MMGLNKTITVTHDGFTAVVGIASICGTGPARLVRFRIEMRGKTFRQSDYGGHWEMAVFNKKDWYRMKAAMYPTAIRSHYRRVTSTKLLELLNAIIARSEVTSVNWGKNHDN